MAIMTNGSDGQLQAEQSTRLRCLFKPDHLFVDDGHRAFNRRVDGNTKSGLAVVSGRAADDLALGHPLAELDCGQAGFADVLLQADACFAGVEQLGIEWSDVAKAGQTELLHQARHGSLAIVHVQLGAPGIEGRVLPAPSLGAKPAFVLHANVAGVEVLGACIKAAQVALAAE